MFFVVSLGFGLFCLDFCCFFNEVCVVVRDVDFIVFEGMGRVIYINYCV